MEIYIYCTFPRKGNKNANLCFIMMIPMVAQARLFANIFSLMLITAWSSSLAFKLFLFITYTTRNIFYITTQYTHAHTHIHIIYLDLLNTYIYSNTHIYIYVKENCCAVIPTLAILHSILFKKKHGHNRLKQSYNILMDSGP